MSLRREVGISVSAEGGVDPRVVPPRLRRSWGILARRFSSRYGKRPTRSNSEVRP